MKMIRTVSPKVVRWLLWSGMLILVGIGVAASIRRTLDLAQLLPPPRFSPMGSADTSFKRYATLTLTHILPGALFLLIGPFQFSRRFRNHYPVWHRRLGYVYLVSGVIIGITALRMSFLMTIGGANETAATTLFALLFLFSLGKGLQWARRRIVYLHRIWMFRAYAIGLSIATIRIIVVLFFALSNLSPSEFFGIAFWLGFTLQLLAVEAWIQSGRAGHSKTMRYK